MTTIDLLPHEIAELPRLRAVWRPVKPAPAFRVELVTVASGGYATF